MSKLVLEKQYLGTNELGRRLRTALVLDVSQPVSVKKRYWVRLLCDGARLQDLGPFPADEARELYDAYCLWLHPRGDTGLRAVLDRCRGKRTPTFGDQWRGSMAEYAARRHPIGSYEWVLALVAYRELMKKDAEQAQSK